MDQLRIINLGDPEGERDTLMLITQCSHLVSILQATRILKEHLYHLAFQSTDSWCPEER